ncbi:hypothetical protein QVD17_01005 [Tagetes erecta]|uniref:Uncharacterized protein n=1 Tax=Tagetes erecta TaxID=13708 RepID=A0AAD8P7I5_TARER|nr:hypothetical protein QVD17_01005 [Tagetes erecta]
MSSGGVILPCKSSMIGWLRFYGLYFEVCNNARKTGWEVKYLNTVFGFCFEFVLLGNIKKIQQSSTRISDICDPSYFGTRASILHDRVNRSMYTNL